MTVCSSRHCDGNDATQKADAVIWGHTRKRIVRESTPRVRLAGYTP